MDVFQESLLHDLALSFWRQELLVLKSQRQIIKGHTLNKPQFASTNTLARLTTFYATLMSLDMWEKTPEHIGPSSN